MSIHPTVMELVQAIDSLHETYVNGKPHKSPEVNDGIQRVARCIAVQFDRSKMQLTVSYSSGITVDHIRGAMAAYGADHWIIARYAGRITKAVKSELAGKWV